jgi:hypothetical protein
LFLEKFEEFMGMHAVIGLQRVMVHIISKELLRNRKGLQAASHCLHSLLESMVDLKELIESSETDGSGESASGDEDDDDNSSDVRTNSSRILTVLLTCYYLICFHVPPYMTL